MSAATSTPLSAPTIAFSTDDEGLLTVVFTGVFAGGVRQSFAQPVRGVSKARTNRGVRREPKELVAVLEPESRVSIVDALGKLNERLNEVLVAVERVGELDRSGSAESDVSHGSSKSSVEPSAATEVAPEGSEAEGSLSADSSASPVVHFWLCTDEGRPFFSRILCDAGAQRSNAGGRMTSGWPGVTCPECLAAGRVAADAIRALPDEALIALGAWTVSS